MASAEVLFHLARRVDCGQGSGTAWEHRDMSEEKAGAAGEDSLPKLPQSLAPL